MSGYWAMGRPRIETIPTITMMIEMTMATMGRLMKNLVMAIASYCSWPATGFPPAVGAGCGADGADCWAVGVSSDTSFGLTVMPSFTFWSPSTTMRSPGWSPSAITMSDRS